MTFALSQNKMRRQLWFWEWYYVERRQLAWCLTALPYFGKTRHHQFKMSRFSCKPSVHCRKNATSHDFLLEKRNIPGFCRVFPANPFKLHRIVWKLEITSFFVILGLSNDSDQDHERSFAMWALSSPATSDTHYLAARKHNIDILLAAQFLVYDIIKKPQLVLMSSFCAKTIIVVIING